MYKSFQISSAKKWMSSNRHSMRDRVVLWLILNWPFSRGWRMQDLKQFICWKHNDGDSSWDFIDIPVLERVVYSKIYDLHSLNKLFSGLKSLNKKYPEKFSSWNLEYLDDFQYQVASMSPGGNWNVPLGWIDLSDSAMSKHYSKAWVSLVAISPRLVSVQIAARPSGRLLYEYKRAMRTKSNGWIKVDKCPLIKIHKVKLVGIPQSRHRQFLVQNALLGAHSDMSEWLNRRLGDVESKGGLWQSTEVFTRCEYSKEFIAQHDWNALGAFELGNMSYIGKGFWLQSEQETMGEPRFPTWKLFVSEKEILNTENGQENLYNVLNYELHSFCSLASLRIMQINLEDEINRLHIKYRNLSSGNIFGLPLWSFVSANRLHSKSLAIAYQVSELLSGLNHKRVDRIFYGRYLESRYQTLSGEITEGKLVEGWLARVRESINFCDQKSDLLIKQASLRFEKTNAVSLFLLACVNIALVLAGIYFAYLFSKTAH